eukprot:3833020-Rhodomonas_salina.2
MSWYHRDEGATRSSLPVSLQLRDYFGRVREDLGHVRSDIFLLRVVQYQRLERLFLRREQCLSDVSVLDSA